MFLVAHEGRAAGDVEQISGYTASALINAGICAFATVDGSPAAVAAEPELPSGPEGEPLAIADEELERIAKERGFVLAPKAFVDRLVEITKADEETGIPGAVETLSSERNGLVAAATTIRELLGLEEGASLVDSIEKLKETSATAAASDAKLVDAIEAVIGNSAGSLDRLSEDTLAKLLVAKGVAEIPETKAAKISLLKPAPQG